MNKQKEVIIYTTKTCYWCSIAKDFFKKHNINFKEIDVSKDQKAAKQMIEKSGQMGVPVIEIDGEIVIGFDEPELKKKLGLK